GPTRLSPGTERKSMRAPPPAARRAPPLIPPTIAAVRSGWNPYETKIAYATPTITLAATIVTYVRTRARVRARTFAYSIRRVANIEVLIGRVRLTPGPPGPRGGPRRRDRPARGQRIRRKRRHRHGHGESPRTPASSALARDRRATPGSPGAPGVASFVSHQTSIEGGSRLSPTGCYIGNDSPNRVSPSACAWLFRRPRRARVPM